MIADYLRANTELRDAVGIDAKADLELQPIGSGEHNLNFRFDDPATGRAFVLRVNVASQPFHDNQVAYEFAALSALEPSGCTPRPLYLDDSPSAPGKGALVIDFREGDELDFDALRPGDIRCALQMMADVHAVPVSDSFPLHRPSDPLRELFEECLQRFETYRASAFEDERITKWAARFIAAARTALDAPFDARDSVHIVNTETLPSHFLIPAASSKAATRTGARGRLCDVPGSFIDWERPIVGEVAQDLAYFVSPTTTYWDSECWFPAREAESVVEQYWQAVDGRFERGGFDERFRAYRMMTALRSVTWCCRALIAYRGGAGHTTEKTAAKLPLYLSDGFMERLAAECFDL